MPRKKTVKFSYEGSSKPIKFFYLIGLININIGSLLLLTSVFFGFFNIHIKQIPLDNWDLFFISLGFVLIGNILVWITQFLNWWDRGSINSKIFR